VLDIALRQPRIKSGGDAILRQPELVEGRTRPARARGVHAASLRFSIAWLGCMTWKNPKLEQYKDTADLFTGISCQMDKDLWFLEAHLG
jgi:hypothetical protein